MINIPFKKKTKIEIIEKNPDVILQNFAVTANAGFRREVFEENDMFDPIYISGEDMEIYFRMLYKTKWKGIFNPQCRMYHFYRSSFKALMKQWIWYGKGHPRVFCKYGEKGIHIYYPNIKAPKSEDELADWKVLHKLVTIPFFSCGFIALTPFNLFLMTFILSILCLIFTTPLLFKISAWVCLAFFLFTFLNGVKLTALKKSLSYSFIRFSLNLCFIITGFIQGLKLKTIFLDVSFERSSPGKVE